MTTVIALVLALAVAKFLRSAGAFVTTSHLKTEAAAELRHAMAAIQKDLEEANEINFIWVSSIQVVLDSTRLPGYDPTQVVNGFPRNVNPDDDGDMAALPPTWRTGNDLNDDDDDNDGRIDVLCTYELTADRRLVRTMTHNGVNETPETLLAHVHRFRLTPFGSVNHIVGAAADANGDGIVTEAEIDDLGNNNNRIDTPGERSFVALIDVDLAQDRNRDGRQDGDLGLTVAPPLIAGKRP